jgi:hypothetical protein
VAKAGDHEAKPVRLRPIPLGFAIVIGIVSTWASSPAMASEQLDICATYTNTERSYHVQATKRTGAELNSATNSFSYNTFSTYIVIFWAQNQASVIQMDGFVTFPSVFPMSGSDQEGRPWQIVQYSPWNCN